MSEAIQRIEKITGVPIGNLRDPLAPIYDAIQEKGLLKPHISWVSELRYGGTLGRQKLIKWELDLTDPNDPSKKDRLYRKVATEGVSNRTYSNEPAYMPRYASDGFVEHIAENLKLKGDDIRAFLAAMRADLVFGSNTSEHNNFFIHVAEAYLRANTEGLFPSRRKEALVSFNEDWDRQSPLTFYQKFYSTMGGSTRRLAGWIPYEIEVFQRFYEARTLSGKVPPTQFDERVLICQNIEVTGRLAKEVRDATNIAINYDLVVKHRNALVYGKPTSGLFD